VRLHIQDTTLETHETTDNSNELWFRSKIDTTKNKANSAAEQCRTERKQANLRIVLTK
jgi:hypothetical protein